MSKVQAMYRSTKLCSAKTAVSYSGRKEFYVELRKIKSNTPTEGAYGRTSLEMQIEVLLRKFKLPPSEYYNLPLL